MRLEWQHESGRLVFTASEEPGEYLNHYRQPDGTQRLHAFIGGRFVLELDDGIDTDAIHPDLFGLAAILLFHEFTPERITVDRAVSRNLHDAYRQSTGKLIGPVDDQLVPRSAPADGVPALALSFGTDSMAALALMPSETKPIYIERIRSRERGLHNLAAAQHAIDALGQAGRPVQIFATDAEQLISPPGLSHGMAMTWPIAILADYLNVDAIGYGSILETHYRVLDNKFRSVPGLLGVRDLDETFAAAGLPFIHVTAGLSEVATTAINLSGPYSAMTQSCQRGPEHGQPCMACGKCLRKLPLEDVIANRETDPTILSDLLSSGYAASTFAANPMYFQSVFMYLAARIRTDDPTWRLLAAKTGGTVENTGWMEHWYWPAGELLPEKYRAVVGRSIAKHVEPMTASEIAQAENWNLLNRPVPLSRRWGHWKFWKTLQERYGHEHATVVDPRVRITVGAKTQLVVRRRDSFLRSSDIGDQIEWRSRHRKIAKTKGDRLRGRQPGIAFLNAEYAKQKLVVEVEVLPADAEPRAISTVGPADQ